MISQGQKKSCDGPEGGFEFVSLLLLEKLFFQCLKKFFFVVSVLINVANTSELFGSLPNIEASPYNSPDS